MVAQLAGWQWNYVNYEIISSCIEVDFSSVAGHIQHVMWSVEDPSTVLIGFILTFFVCNRSGVVSDFKIALWIAGLPPTENDINRDPDLGLL